MRDKTQELYERDEAEAAREQVFTDLDRFDDGTPNSPAKDRMTADETRRGVLLHRIETICRDIKEDIREDSFLGGSVDGSLQRGTARAKELAEVIAKARRADERFMASRLYWRQLGKPGDAWEEDVGRKNLERKEAA